MRFAQRLKDERIVIWQAIWVEDVFSTKSAALARYWMYNSYLKMLESPFRTTNIAPLFRSVLENKNKILITMRREMFYWMENIWRTKTRRDNNMVRVCFEFLNIVFCVRTTEEIDTVKYTVDVVETREHVAVWPFLTGTWWLY